MARRKATRRVGLAVGYPAGFEDEIVRGALDYAEQVGHWDFVSHGHRPFMPFEEIDLGAVDGVIGLLSPDWVGKIVQAGIAAVNCSTRHADLPLPRVGNDDEAIGRLAAEHLLERGFGQFGFMGHLPLWYTRRRLAGFRHVLEQRARRACELLDLADVQGTAMDAKVRPWLQQVPKPIGVMVENDTLGLRVIRIATELELRIPEDLSVLGVDNDRWATALSPVPMSSVELDVRQIGYQAAALLDKLMAGKPAPPPMWIGPVGVVRRRSTDIVVQENPLVVGALRFIRDHCEQEIAVEDVLNAIGVSRRTLEMHLKHATGQTPQAAISRARIERAERLLERSQSTIGEVARACGYERQEQFNRVFKRLTGLTPGQFRQRRVGSRTP